MNGMVGRCWLLCSAIAIVLAGSFEPTQGQVVGLGGTGNGLSDRFFERVTVTGANGLGPVLPPFGGYDPSADARLSINWGNVGATLTAGQGSHRTMVSQSPVLVVPNGGSGTFFSGQVRPFVTGIVPIVGYGGGDPMWAYENLSTPAGPSDLPTRIARWQAAGAPTGPVRRSQAAASHNSSPDDQMQHDEDNTPVSSADHGDASVAAIKAAKVQANAQRDGRVDELENKARDAEQRGRLDEALHFYRRAHREARGERRAELGQRIRDVETRQVARHP